MNSPIWSSDPIYIDADICVDVHAGSEGVTLGEVHGEHRVFAADLRLSPEHAEVIACALLKGADKARGAGA